MCYRQNDFKILEIHGHRPVIWPSGLENRLRNLLFFDRSINLGNELINILAYEMPLCDNQRRGPCVDLFGIDSKNLPVIIELKLRKTTTGEIRRHGFDPNLPKTMLQCVRYKFIFDRIRDFVFSESRDKGVNFHSAGQRLIILANKKYFGLKRPVQIPCDWPNNAREELRRRQ